MDNWGRSYQELPETFSVTNGKTDGSLPVMNRDGMQLILAGFVKYSTVNGPGKRAVVWV